jgi:hypothetical protein
LPRSALFGIRVVRFHSPPQSEEFPQLVDAEGIAVELQRNVLPGDTSIKELECRYPHFGCVTEALPRAALLEIPYL